MVLEGVKEITSKFSRHKVLVVGDVILDHYVHGVVERINPEAPVPILRATEERKETGGAGNTAKNVASLGAESILVSVVGDDENAGLVRDAAAKEGYRAVLVRDNSRPTIRKTRHLVGNQHMLRVDYEEIFDILPEIEMQLITAIKREIAGGVDAILVSDYAKGVITKRIAEVILDEAGQRDILVGADIKPSRAAYFLGATFVSPNMKEAHEYLGINHLEQQVAPHELARMVYMKMCADVFLTLGKDGIFVFCGGECGSHVQQNNVIEVADESGAGDTSAVVLMLSLLSGATEMEAARLANAGGAVVVSKVGSVGITVGEIEKMLRESGKQPTAKETAEEAGKESA